MGVKINESSIRTIRQQYLLRQKLSTEPFNEVIPKKRGRPKLLGDELDQTVCDYIKDLREAGGVINTNIVQSVGKGVIMSEDPSLLDTINLTREWARSIMERLNFKKRKATKGVKHLPEDFELIKQQYLDRIHKNIEEHDIPASLVINWDQTGLNMVPASEWTMEEKGTKQVKLVGRGDKRQITALLASTLSGVLLPPQLIYAGKTEQCHPKVDFPDSWDITHSESHWSYDMSMIRYAEKIIIPYVEGIREGLELSRINQQALTIFDLFKAHRNEALLDMLKKHHISVVFVPPRCTDKLQSLDQTINKKYKENIKSEFQNWYSSKEIAKEITENKSGERGNISQIDLKTSVIKPLHAKWIIKCHKVMEKETDFLIRAFTSVGISRK